MATNKENFDHLQIFFNKQEWYYTSEELEEDRYLIQSGLNGENIQFDFYILCNNEDIFLRADLPMKFNNENIETLSKKILEINTQLVYGIFKYDFEDNLVYYSYRFLTDGIQLNDKLVRNIVYNSCLKIDEFAKDIIQLA